MQKDNATSVLIKLVEALKIPVTRSTISKELARHPDHDNLAGLSDLLTRLQVANTAFYVDFDQLSEVPTPYIAYLKNKEFVVVTAITENSVMLAGNRRKGRQLLLTDFKKQFSGNVLFAEKSELSGEADYSVKRKKEFLSDLLQPAVLTVAFLLLVLFVFFQTDFVSQINGNLSVLLSLKTVGLITSILLLVQSIDANNPWIHQLCGGKKTNCSNILNSKAAKVFDGLSWSETGFFYFLGTWLVVLFNPGHRALTQSLAMLNLLCLPYTFYSIYFQWRVAKQWCVFCCTVQAVLWLEFFTLLPYLSISGWAIPNAHELVNLATCLIIPVVLWLFLRPYLSQLKKITNLDKELRSFKYNNALFNFSLKNGPRYALLKEGQAPIIGNPEAEIIVTMVSNPLCKPCAQVHNELKWIESHPDVKLQMVFHTHDDSGRKSDIARRILSLTDNCRKAKNAVHDWYEQKQGNFDKWLQAHPADASSEVSQMLLEQHRQWCRLADIQSTPAIFIDGYRLPYTYRAEDIKYLI